MRRTTGALFAAVVIAVARVIAAAGPPPRAIAQDDSIELALVAQNFAIAPDGMLHLEYELTGTIPDPTTSTTPATTTTPPITTSAIDDTGRPHRAPTRASHRARQRHLTTTATTVPAAGPELTVLVTALDPITLRSEVAEVLDGGFRIGDRQRRVRPGRCGRPRI